MKSCQVSERQEEHDPLVSPQATRDLAQYDAAHHEEFKRYEMLKEHERRRYLESLGEEQRKEAERKLQEQQRRHREHPKVNVPVRTPHMLYHIQFLSRKKKKMQKQNYNSQEALRQKVHLPMLQGFLGIVVLAGPVALSDLI